MPILLRRCVFQYIPLTEAHDGQARLEEPLQSPLKGSPLSLPIPRGWKVHRAHLHC
jgi:hypothetical protein